MFKRGSLILFVLSILVLGVGASTASADGTIARVGSTLRYASGPIGVNDLSVDKTSLGYVFTSAASTPISASAGCTFDSATSSVVCADTSGSVSEVHAPLKTVGSGVPATTRVVARTCFFSSESQGPEMVICDTGSSDATDNVSIVGGAGADEIIAGPNASGYLDGGPGQDTLYVTTEHPASDCPTIEFGCIDTHGGEGSDVIDASESTGDVYYSAGDGNDVFLGGSGDDEIVVGTTGDVTGRDTLFGGAGNDRIYDYIFADGGDNIFGGTGNDVITLAGCDPNPSYNAYASTTVNGGLGRDSFGYVTNNSAFGCAPGYSNDNLELSLDGAANDRPIARSGHTQRPSDNILGVEDIAVNPGRHVGGNWNGNDVLSGDGDDNTINGFGGSDTITGGAGSDELNGGTGADHIYATDGEADLVDCGDGADVVDADSIDILEPSCEPGGVTIH